MRQAFWLFILLVVAGLIAYGARHFPGTAEFMIAGYKITMSIYVFAFLQLLTIMALLLLWRMYRAVVNVPSRFGSWREKSREDRALAAVKTATIALHEGRWAHADKAAKIASRSAQSAGLGALLGAASANAQTQPIAAQAWLDKLSGEADFADVAALQKAQMAIQNNDANAALSALDQASGNVRKHSERYYALRVQALSSLGHWHEVLQITKDNKWHAPIATKNAWFAQAAQFLCGQTDSSTAYLQSLYKDMPDAVRSDEPTFAAYINALIQRDEKQIARRTIEDALKFNWRPALLPLYVQASDEISYTAQLKALDGWEAAHQNDADFWCAAAQLCLKAHIWGRAKANFQNSLAIKPTVAAYFGLAQTYRAMNDIAQAQEEERKAAVLAAV